MKELIEMLRWCRPAGSNTEEEFIAKFIDPLGARADGFGNRIVRIGDSNVMWSSHTDTVHKAPGKVKINVDGNIVRVDAYSKANCLGADCTTGVWLMMEMIRAKVPGLYVFHRAEEVGCQGSEWIIRNTPELLDPIDICIAFDRYGTNSIITHQCMERGCSEQFSQSLQKFLPGYSSDPTGSFTDSYTYFDLVSECTNISVGYNYQHTPGETQDLKFAKWLRDLLLEIDTSKLAISRVPGAETTSFIKNSTTTSRSNREVDLYSVVYNYPQEVADFLQDLGVSGVDLADYVRAIHELG